MEKSYLNLLLQDFLDIVSGERDRTKHTLTIRAWNDGEDEPEGGNIVGTLAQIKEVAADIRPGQIRDDFYRAISEIQQRPVYQVDDFSNIEIYNYLEFITSGFNPEKVKRIWFDVDCYYHLTYLENLHAEACDVYVENGWEIPYKEFTMQSEICKIPDYKTMMRRAAIGLDGYGMSYVRSVLKSKMKANTDRQHTRLECLFEALSEYVTGDQHAFVYALTHKAPYRNNKLQWIGRPVDAALFVDVFFDGSFAAFMKCFELKGGRKVRASDRPEGTKDKYPICDIIKLYTK